MDIKQLELGIKVKQSMMTDKEQHEIRIISNSYHPDFDGRLPVCAICVFKKNTNIEDIFEMIMEVENEYPNCYNFYWTTNPCLILHTPSGYTCTKDNWISRRTAILVDCDAIKHVTEEDIVLDKKGKAYKRSSSDVEKEFTKTAIKGLIKHLGATIGLSKEQIMVVDSGSGTQLHILIDHKRSDSMYDGCTDQFRSDQAQDTRIFETINRYFKIIVENNIMKQTVENTLVDIDRSVFSAANLARLPGTINRKGPDTPNRPWRPTQVLWCPTEPRPLTSEQFRNIELLARELLPVIVEAEKKVKVVKESKGTAKHSLVKEKVYSPSKDYFNHYNISYYDFLMKYTDTIPVSHSRCQCPFHHGVDATAGIYENGLRCWSASECDRFFSMSESIKILIGLPDYHAVKEWARKEGIWVDKPTEPLSLDMSGFFS